MLELECNLGFTNPGEAFYDANAMVVRAPFIYEPTDYSFMLFAQHACISFQIDKYAYSRSSFQQMMSEQSY
ncbi:hypothetical protein ASC85_27060 [Pseudomonas sp. Root401]|nr:hypothetical protein ASC85_27060 [Pseudomonas sp. Root401]